MASLHSCHAGRRGDDIRGDVWLSYEPTPTPFELEFHSKLEALYGDSTRALLKELAQKHGLDLGRLTVEDKGAYPFVLRARMESLLQQAFGNPSLRVEPESPVRPGPGGRPSMPPMQRDRLRRSRLYLPGNEAKYMLNAALHQPDAIILDIEDSVAASAKQDARSMVRHALLTLDFGGCERMVRINQGAEGLLDLAALEGAPFHLLLLPKVETAQEIQEIETALQGRELLLMPILETARGILNADAIASASSRNVALTLGLEDLTADLGVVKTKEGKETTWACSQVVFAAKANGLQAIDSVYGNIADECGLRASVRVSKAMGFEGKGCVHPRQVAVVHEEFSPSEEELDRAQKIVAAFEEAEAQGLGVVSLGSKMIDPPVVKRALNLVRLARAKNHGGAGHE